MTILPDCTASDSYLYMIIKSPENNKKWLLKSLLVHDEKKIELSYSKGTLKKLVSRHVDKSTVPKT